MANGEKSIVVAFVPVIHTGYVQFFKKYPGTLYLVSSEIANESIKLERHLRTLDVESIKKAIQALTIFDEVKILTKDSFIEISKSSLPVVMPDEDISHAIAESYLSGKGVVFEPVFLRWDKQITLVEHEVPAHRIITQEAFHKEMIAEANNEKDKSEDWWRQIAALIVKDGKVALKGHNRELPSHRGLDVYGDPRSNFNAGERIDLSLFIHAEAQVIANAAREGISTLGASMYVTTFPCPACAKLIAESGIKKVYYEKGYSLLDAEEILKHYGVELVLVK